MKKFYEGLIFRWDNGKAYHLEMDEKDIAQYIITSGSPSRIDILGELLDNAEIYTPRRGLKWTKGEYKGINILGFTSGMGVGSMGITLTEIMALSLKTNKKIHIIRVGTSGALQEYIPPKSIIIPTAVVRDESVSNKLIYKEYPSDMDPVIFLSLIDAAVEKGYKIGKNLFLGKTHSKDDLYFYEGYHNSPIGQIHQNKFNAFKKMGVLATEMEASLLPIYRDYFNNLSIEKGYKTKFYVGGIFTTLKSPMKMNELEDIEKNLIKLTLDGIVNIEMFWMGKKSLDHILRKI